MKGKARGRTQKLTRNAFALWGGMQGEREGGIIKELKVDARRE